MRNYELTIVLPGGTTPAKKKSEVAKIKKMITTFKGKVGKVDDWGELNLAYLIDENDTGIFLLFNLAAFNKCR